MKTIIAFVVVFTALAADVRAQRPADSLFVTGELDAQGSFAGGGGEMEWLHSLSEKSSLTVGGTSASVDQLWWAYGTLGGFTRRGKVIVSGRASLGTARLLGDNSAYVRVLGSATMPLSSAFAIEAEGQRVLLLGLGTNVTRIGTAFTGSRRFTARASYNIVASQGTGTAQSVTARGDVPVGKLGFLGGVTITRAPKSHDAAAVELLTYPDRDFFAGATIPVSGSRLILVMEIVPQATGNFSRVMATWQLPLRSGAVSAAEAGK